MGSVYKARQVGLNRLVALTMIRGGSQAPAEFLARLPIEAEAVARLRHSNILQIYEIGEVEGLPFLSLELLEESRLSLRAAAPFAERNATKSSVPPANVRRHCRARGAPLFLPGAVLAPKHGSHPILR
jgi:serine/threonine protein kinase